MRYLCLSVALASVLTPACKPGWDAPKLNERVKLRPGIEATAPYTDLKLRLKHITPPIMDGATEKNYAVVLDLATGSETYSDLLVRVGGKVPIGKYELAILSASFDTQDGCELLVTNRRDDSKVKLLNERVNLMPGVEASVPNTRLKVTLLSLSGIPMHDGYGENFGVNLALKTDREAPPQILAKVGRTIAVDEYLFTIHSADPRVGPGASVIVTSR